MPYLKLCLLLMGAIGLSHCVASPREPAATVASAPPPSRRPRLTSTAWPDAQAPLAIVHQLAIPNTYPVEIAIAPDGQLQSIETFAITPDILASINGGFFDPNNGQTTSFITIDGELVADPRANQRLVGNPDLTAYIEQILNRSEFRRYDCGDDLRYDITVHQASPPDNCTIHSALGAGPQLLPVNTSQQEGFTDYLQGERIRDAIGEAGRNARSAIGIDGNHHLLWVMVEQTTPTGGMTLEELTNFMAAAGIEKALNLDGGSSASLHGSSFITGNETALTHYGRLDSSGNGIRRPVKSALRLLQPPSQENNNRTP